MTIHGNSAIIPREFGTGDLSALYNGEMSERFKELVLKTSDAATRRGFESHSLRQHPLKAVPALIARLERKFWAAHTQ